MNGSNTRSQHLHRAAYVAVTALTALFIGSTNPSSLAAQETLSKEQVEYLLQVQANTMNTSPPNMPHGKFLSASATGLQFTMRMRSDNKPTHPNELQEAVLKMCPSMRSYIESYGISVNIEVEQAQGGNLFVAKLDSVSCGYTAPPSREIALKDVSAQAAPTKNTSRVAANTYDFKGIPLGIALNDFKSLPNPDGKAGSRAVCTGDKVMQLGELTEPLEVAKYGDDKQVGLITCVYMGAGPSGSFEDVTGLNLGGGLYGSYRYAFEFVPDAAGVPRLYEISLPTNIAAETDILPALTEKFGRPKAVPGTMQTRAGAKFEQMTYLWSNTESSITVQTRFSKIDDMILLFTHKSLSTRKNALQQAKKAAIPNKI